MSLDPNAPLGRLSDDDVLRLADFVSKAYATAKSDQTALLMRDLLSCLMEIVERRRAEKTTPAVE